MLCIGNSVEIKNKKLIPRGGQCEEERKGSPRKEDLVGLSFLKEMELTLGMHINSGEKKKWVGKLNLACIYIHAHKHSAQVVLALSRSSTFKLKKHLL